MQTSILNLVVNACDAMPGGGTLTIATANVTIQDHDRLAPGDYLAVSVSDSGNGMTNGVIEHAFEPFFTTKDIGKGSGLGLSTVYGMVKQLGGDVTIVSSTGRGSTIKPLLPWQAWLTRAPGLQLGKNRRARRPNKMPRLRR
ncbi:MAG: ATP-binding protein [Methyloceanibacter sp.]|uniref:ATP-binding protein n=1 Tax=Methyloceanibacter sp. TaxID=1965321 RepID=UPI003D9BE359